MPQFSRSENARENAERQQATRAMLDFVEERLRQFPQYPRMAAESSSYTMLRQDRRALINELRALLSEQSDMQRGMVTPRLTPTFVDESAPPTEGLTMQFDVQESDMPEWVSYEQVFPTVNETAQREDTPMPSYVQRFNPPMRVFTLATMEDTEGVLFNAGTAVVCLAYDQRNNHYLLEFPRAIIGGHNGSHGVTGREGACYWLPVGAFVKEEDLNLSDKTCYHCNKPLQEGQVIFNSDGLLFCAACSEPCAHCHNVYRKKHMKKVHYFTYGGRGRALMEMRPGELRERDLSVQEVNARMCPRCARERITRNQCGHPTLRGNSHRTRAHGNQCTKCYRENFKSCGRCGNTYLRTFVRDLPNDEGTMCRRCDLQIQPHTTAVKFHDSKTFDQLQTKRHFAVELEVEDGDWSVLDTMPKTFQWKVDLSLDPETGIEFNTPIANGDLGYAYLDKWHKLAVEKAGFKVSHRCGLHVHVNVNDYSPEQLTNVLRQYSVFEDVFNAMISYDRAHGRWCNPFPWDKEYWALNIPASREDVVNHILNKIRSQRYWGLNTAAIHRFGSLEFRHHEGTVDLQGIKDWVYLCTLFVEKAAAMDTVIVPPKSFRDLLFMFWAAFEVPTHIRRYMLNRIRKYNVHTLTAQAHRKVIAKERKHTADYAKAIIPVKEYRDYKHKKQVKVEEFQRKFKATADHNMYCYDFALYEVTPLELQELYDRFEIDRDCSCATCEWAREEVRLKFKPKAVLRHMLKGLKPHFDGVLARAEKEAAAAKKALSDVKAAKQAVKDFGRTSFYSDGSAGFSGTTSYYISTTTNNGGDSNG